MTDRAFSWFLPTGGDGHHIGAVTSVQARSEAATERAATVDYLSQVARTAESAGFSSLLTPVGLGCVDPWVVTSAVAPTTSTISYLVALRPGLASPTLVAQQAATFARLTGGRIALNVVTGGDPVEQRAYGDPLDHAARYARTAEFLTVVRGLLRGETVTFSGQHIQVEGAALVDVPDVPPEIYLGGASAAALEIAASQVDTYLSWVEGWDAALARRTVVVDRARERGRSVRFGLRLHVIARETSAEAWAHTDDLLAGLDEAAIAASQARFARMDSVAQREMTALHGGRRARLEVDQGLWAGAGLVREGAATALVGSYDEVADRIVALLGEGVDELVLSGWPHLEEAQRFGQHVRPRVEERLRSRW